MMICARFAIPIAALLLSACAARPTSYMPREGGFGYHQTQIDSRTWRVVFAGNADTPRETVENYLLYRAAEIMLFGGHEDFIVLEKEVERTLEYRPLDPYPYPHRYANPYPYPYRYRDYRGRRYRRPWHGGYGAPSYTAWESYKAFATIRIYSGGPAPAGLQVYAAREVIVRLGQSVVLPKK